MYRHGDLLLSPISALPTGVVSETRVGDIILAVGEATGHAHRIKTPGAVTLVSGGDRFLVVGDAPAELSHEEHATVTLPSGVYRVRRQRTYSPAGIRQVAD